MHDEFPHPGDLRKEYTFAYSFFFFGFFFSISGEEIENWGAVGELPYLDTFSDPGVINHHIWTVGCLFVALIWQKLSP